MDAARVCGVYRCKPWRDADLFVPMRWYRTPPGAPFLPVLHTFSHPNWTRFNFFSDPGEGQAGFVRDMELYSKGQPPAVYAPRPGHFCGSERQWLQGSDIATDPSLDWTEFGVSTCCGIPTPDSWFDLMVREDWELQIGQTHTLGNEPAFWLILWKNGQLLRETADYTRHNAVITFLDVVQSVDSFSALYR